MARLSNRNREPIRILADVPTSTPSLGFPDYVEALSDAIRGGHPAQFTVGLYGPWGSGKSSLLKAIAAELSKDENVLVCTFDAWRYERSEHIVVPLLHAVASSAAAARRFKTAGKQVAKFLLSLTSGLTFKVPGAELDLDDVSDHAASLIDDGRMKQMDAVFLRPFADLRAIPSKLGDKRIVVLIDDLDRCSPGNVMALLEAINLITDIEGFVFVLALDYEVIVRAVNHKYPHVSGHNFIEKMIQVPFRVPPLDTHTDLLLRELVPDWSTLAMAADEATVVALKAVAQSALRGNPRQIKRLINYVLLLERVISHRQLGLSSHALVHLVGLQLAWPDAYRELQEAAQYELPQPFEAIKVAEDDRLAAYAPQVAEAFPDLQDLRQALQLTFTVETPPVVEAIPVDPPMVAGTTPLGEQEMTQLKRSVEKVLLENEWTPEHTSSDLSGERWNHPRRRELRIVFHTSTVSLEFDDGTGFQTTRSVDFLAGRNLVEEAIILVASNPQFDLWKSVFLRRANRSGENSDLAAPR